MWQAVRELIENAEANTNDMLDTVNVIEDEEVRTEQAEKSVVLSTSSTYRTPETQQGDSKSKFEQRTLSIAKYSEDIKGSTAHVDNREEDSPKDIKTDKDESIKTREVNEKKEDDGNNSSDQNIEIPRLKDTSAEQMRQLIENATGAIETVIMIEKAHKVAGVIPDS